MRGPASAFQRRTPSATAISRLQPAILAVTGPPGGVCTASRWCVPLLPPELWFGVMERKLIPITAALLAALAAGLWLWSSRDARPVATGSEPDVSAPAPAPAAPAGSMEGRIAALEKELAAERDARLGLESEVEMLRLLLEESAGAPAKTVPGAAAAEPAPPAA